MRGKQALSRENAAAGDADLIDIASADVEAELQIRLRGNEAHFRGILWLLRDVVSWE
jgi:hypothetical protein